jgi:hypothetical protein
MDVSVILCTRNRASSLNRTLQSLAGLSVPAGLRWELIVVDNNSTDDTPAVIAGFSGVLPIVAVSEARAGLSHARNRGVQAATGTYIVWTDDDVVVDPQWLAAYVEAFRRWPEAAVFGGRIIPVFEEPSPAWARAARAELIPLMAHRDFGEAPLPLSPADDVMPFGASFAVRAAEQRAFPYDPELGVAPGRARCQEETEVVRAILASGATGYWLPGPKVAHCISLRRQTTGYVVRFCAASGETDAFLKARRAPGEGRSGRQLFGAPRWLWRRVGELYLGYLFARCTAAPAVWCRRLKVYAYTRGELAFHVKRHRAARSA